MKKIIIKNDKEELKIKYIIYNKKCSIYIYDKKYKNKHLSFYKNNMDHRPCNEGPQYKDQLYNLYRENCRLHNLYGYAYIDKTYDIKEYWIYHIEYTKPKFLNYLSIYNNLTYKRSY